MRGLRRWPKRRSCVAHGVGEPAPPGTTSSGWRSPSSPSAAQSAFSASPPRAEPAADLDDGQHGPRAASSPASATAGPHAAAAHRRARRPLARAARRPRAPGGRRRRPRRPAPRAAADAAPGAPRPRSGHLLGVQVGGDRVDLAVVELLPVGAHEPGDALARERDRGRAAVGRWAVVRLRREIAEDEVDVGGDREALRRHRAPAAADRHARAIAARLVRSTPV